MSARSSSRSSKVRTSRASSIPKRKRDGSQSAMNPQLQTSATLLHSHSLESPQPRTQERPPVPVPDWSNTGHQDPEKVKLNASRIVSSAKAYQYQQESRPSAIRRSAYRPPGYQPAFTRNPPVLTRHSIYKYTASCSPTGGTVSFHKSSEEYTIELPPLSDWEDKRSVGFVGEGLTKRGIYVCPFSFPLSVLPLTCGMSIQARHLGKEYVVTQLKDPKATQHENKTILMREMDLLVRGHWFKQEFDEEADLYEVKLPGKRANTCAWNHESHIPCCIAFDFNVEGAFIGELVPTATSGSRPLPLLHFIATPLLPCGELDAPIRKFTGNDQVGPANNHITQLIHAFAHFTYLCSGGTLVFCDLQGASDKNDILRLIDPQVHT